MELLNTSTYELRTLPTDRPWPYAILSHTWGRQEDEVTYQDLSDLSIARSKLGWAKIAHTCRQARNLGIEYAWIDTCCIDKSSSSSLSEAINSMFSWYAQSEVCFVILEDLKPSASTPEHCRWFTRGWTLQELIAPTQVRFYDRSWTFRGTRKDLSHILSLLTGIEPRVLRYDSTRDIRSILSSIPVARRMSWAAKRETSRPEDIAYCLLGIFGVNMPMIYGEGENAFVRLQMQIANEVNDLSLFAWRANFGNPEDSLITPHTRPQLYRGVLALHPSEFLRSDELFTKNDPRFNPEFSITNKGLRIRTRLHIEDDTGALAWNLQCTSDRNPTDDVGIMLNHYGGNTWARLEPDKLVRIDQRWSLTGEETLYLTKHIDSYRSASLDYSKRRSFLFTGDFPSTEYYRHVGTEPRDLWDSNDQRFITSGLSSFTACLTFYSDWATETREFIVACGLGSQDPWASILTKESAPDAFAAASLGDMKTLSALGRNQKKSTTLKRTVQISYPATSGEINVSTKTRDRTEQIKVNVAIKGRLSRGTVVFEVEMKHTKINDDCALM